MCALCQARDSLPRCTKLRSAITYRGSNPADKPAPPSVGGGGPGRVRAGSPRSPRARFRRALPPRGVTVLGPATSPGVAPGVWRGPDRCSPLFAVFRAPPPSRAGVGLCRGPSWAALVGRRRTVLVRFIFRREPRFLVWLAGSRQPVAAHRRLWQPLWAALSFQTAPGSWFFSSVTRNCGSETVES